MYIYTYTYISVCVNICVHIATTWCVRRWEYTETHINHIRRYKPLYKLIQKQMKTM